MELKEGLIPVVKAEKDCQVYCPICHKLLQVKAGDVIPGFSSRWLLDGKSEYPAEDIFSKGESTYILLNTPDIPLKINTPA